MACVHGWPDRTDESTSCLRCEIARLQHIIDCAETPLMADVIRERDEARAALREVLAVSKCPYDSECRADVLSSSEDWCPVCKARAALTESITK